MKNKSILKMICHQFDVFPEDVTVEFIASVGTEYEYKVTINESDNPFVVNSGTYTVKVSCEKT